MTDRQKERPRDQLHEGRRHERGGDTVTDGRDSHGNPAATNQGVSEAMGSWRGKRAPFPGATGKHALRSLGCRRVDSRTTEGKHYSAPPCVLPCLPCHSSPRRQLRWRTLAFWYLTQDSLDADSVQRLLLSTLLPIILRCYLLTPQGPTES